MTTVVHTAAGIITCVALIAFLLHLRHFLREHRTLVGIERDTGHLGDRRAMKVRTAKDKKPREVITHADRLRGWVWIRVTWGEPARGKRPEDCQRERVEYALTKWGINRKRAKVLAPERGELELSDFAKIAVILFLVSLALGALGTKMSAGDVWDWSIGVAWDVLSAAWDAVAAELA